MNLTSYMYSLTKPVQSHVARCPIRSLSVTRKLVLNLTSSSSLPFLYLSLTFSTTALHSLPTINTQKHCSLCIQSTDIGESLSTILPRHWV